MWKVMICDDEQEMCAAIRAHLERFSTETGETFSVREVHSGEALLCQFTDDLDLVFLDIKMDGITGMDAARKLRRDHKNVCIIFITTMTQYALEGYEVHAYGFLKKPLRYAQFRLQLLDTLRHLEPRKTANITLKAEGEIHSISLPDLLYLEVLDHDLRFVRINGALTCHATMRDMGESLRGKGFFRCHKSYTVNLAHVARITPDGVKMSNGDVLPVSKHRRKEFLEAFASFVGGGTP
jgi:DNA-binding LytR/AlgR family response regulator